MICCYIIHSEKLNKFYTGACQSNLEERIWKHNTHQYGGHRYTATANDWKLFISFEVDSYDYAVRIERKIKSMKSSKYIRNIKNYPELKSKIINETT